MLTFGGLTCALIFLGEAISFFLGQRRKTRHGQLRKEERARKTPFTLNAGKGNAPAPWQKHACNACLQKANGKQNIVWAHVELISAVGATKISSVAWALSLSGDQLCALRSGFSVGVAYFYGNTWQQPYVSWHRLFRQAWRKGALLALHSYVGSSVCANNFLHGLVSHRLRALIGTANAKSHTPNSWQAWRSRHGLFGIASMQIPRII